MMEDRVLSVLDRPAARWSEGDDGLTIVELMIALLIVMVAFAALASTVIASFTAIRSNEDRVVATALANEAIEDMMAMPWERLGLREDDPDLSFDDGNGDPVFEDEFVVLLEDEGAPAHVEDDPSWTVRDGREYMLTRWVTFVEEDPGFFVKRMIAIVSWDDGRRSIRTEGLRAPDPGDETDLQILSMHVESKHGDNRVALRAPGATILDEDDEEIGVSFRNAESFRIFVVVGDAGSSLTLSFIDRGEVERTKDSPDTDGTATREFTFSPNEYEFPHGSVTFEVEAVGADGQLASDFTTVRFYQPVNVVEDGDVVVEGKNVPAVVRQDDVDEPNKIEIGIGCVPTGDVRVEAEVWGMTAIEAGRDDALTATWLTGTNGDGGGPLPLGQRRPTEEGGVYEESVPGDETFKIGEYTFRIDADRVIDIDGGVEHDLDDDDSADITVTVSATSQEVEDDCQ